MLGPVPCPAVGRDDGVGAGEARAIGAVASDVASEFFQSGYCCEQPTKLIMAKKIIVFFTSKFPKKLADEINFLMRSNNDYIFQI
jgi:hypothetical protein